MSHFDSRFQNGAPRPKIYDISVLVHPRMIVYPGDPEVGIVLHESLVAGDLANVSNITMGTHSGTHVDAPCHISNEGPKLDELDLSIFVGPATMFELGASDVITMDHLSRLRWDGVERVLFKTRNSRFDGAGFREDFAHLSDDAAWFLARHTGVKLVGIDYLSIERYGSTTLNVHKELLERGVVIVEGLNLATVPPGAYELICLPLKLSACDGAPARAILIER